MKKIKTNKKYATLDIDTMAVRGIFTATCSY